MNYLSFSGGKDSQAVAIWLKNQGIDFDMVFCDTGWEHIITYDFITKFADDIGVKCHWIKSKKYNGFKDLSLQKKRVASSQAGFAQKN